VDARIRWKTLRRARCVNVHCLQNTKFAFGKPRETGSKYLPAKRHQPKGTLLRIEIVRPARIHYLIVATEICCNGIRSRSGSFSSRARQTTDSLLFPRCRCFGQLTTLLARFNTHTHTLAVMRAHRHTQHTDRLVPVLRLLSTTKGSQATGPGRGSER
jgi:hypothetical protein